MGGGMSKRYFEFVEGASNKFWEVWTDAKEVHTRYGRVGAAGQTTVKKEGSPEKAQALFDRLVREKLGKGYQEKSGSTKAQKAPVKDAKPSRALTTDFFDAIESKDVKAVKALLATVGVNARNADGEPPLEVAAQKGSLALVKLLVENGAPVNQADAEGFTALIVTAPDAHGVAKYLIEHGANVNAKNKRGATALLNASARVPTSVKIVKLLVDAGADLYAETKEGETPAEYLESFLESDTDGKAASSFIRRSNSAARELRAYFLKKGIRLGHDTKGASPAGDHTRFLAAITKAKSSEKQKPLLAEHFRPWLLTSDCERVFSFLMDRLVKCTVAKNSLRLVFRGDDEDEDDPESAEVHALFGPPAKARGAGSEAVLLRTHGTVVLGEPDAGGISLFFPGGGYDPHEDEEGEETIARFESFCDAGQNWIVSDSGRPNSLGEPSLCLWDHGASLADAEPYPGQSKNSYGAGGLLLRVLAHLVGSEDKAYSAFGYG